MTPVLLSASEFLKERLILGWKKELGSVEKILISTVLLGTN